MQGAFVCSIILSLSNFFCPNLEIKPLVEKSKHILSNNPNSLSFQFDFSNDSLSSGEAFTGSFDLPDHISSVMVNGCSSGLTAFITEQNGEYESSFQTNGFSGEYYASLNIYGENGNTSSGEVYIYSDGLNDTISCSSIESAKREHYINYTATMDDKIYLGIEEMPANYSFSKSEYQANCDYQTSVYEGNDIVFDQSSGYENLSGKIKVEGTALWYDENENAHPLRDTLISLYDRDLLWSELCGVTYTDDNGYYSFEIEDQGFLGFFNRDLYLQLLSETHSTKVGVPKLNRYLIDFVCLTSYSFTTPILSDSHSNTKIQCDFEIHPGISDRSSAFEICQAEILPYEYVKSLENVALPLIDVYYPNVASNVVGDTCFYLNELNYISICKRNYQDWDTLNHEYGHYICDYFGLCSPSFLANHYCGQDLTQDHGLVRGLKLAMSEGLATYLGTASQMMMGTNLNVPRVGDEIYHPLNEANGYFDEYCYGSLSRHYMAKEYCEANEHSITSVLVKLLDNDSRIGDNISLGHQAMWNVLRSNSHWCLSLLISSIVSEYPQLADDVFRILELEHISPNLNAPQNLFLSTNQNDICWNHSWNIDTSSSIYPNVFSLSFSNSFNQQFCINNITSTNFTLNSAQINSVFSLFGSEVKCNVVGYYETLDGLVYGGFSSSSIFLTQPSSTLLTANGLISKSINQGECIWFKYIAPYSGLFSFESTGSLDLVAYAYPKFVTDDTNSNYLAYNDDGGQNFNFKMNIELLKSQIIYIKVRCFSPNSYGSFSVSTSAMHSHNYSHHYGIHSSTKHRAFCDCGDYILEPHVSDGIVTQVGAHRYVHCAYCGIQIDLNTGGPIIIGPDF